MKSKRWGTALSVVLATAALAVVPITAAQAYTPTPNVLFDLGNAQCLKGLGNCAVYPKATQLPDGRLVASFEKSTVVPASGSADGQTLPVYKSDDYGTTWQPLADVKAPAYISDDPAYAKYTSNWTNPYLYVLPKDIGNLKKGTLLLASIVSGDDYYYKEHKAADPNWVPNNDGDRSNLAIALYASTDRGADWNIVNIIATGGWQGGSAGAIGKNIAAANTTAQVDPVWEPYLMVYGDKLVAYYSDENDYLGMDPATGKAIPNPNNDTGPDSHGQILAHRTWDGVASSWSDTFVDVTGLNDTLPDGTNEIGGGRPGMANVVQTTDGKWMLTYEYFGTPTGNRYKLANDPLSFGLDGSAGGTQISTLPVTTGSRGIAAGGSPVLVRFPDGRLAYNAGNNADVWINSSGRSDGTWTENHVTTGAGYSRNLTYVNGTGRVLILQGTWGGANAAAIIRYADIDFGQSTGTYYQVVNRKTGQVIGTTSKTNDADLGNANTADVRLEAAGSASIADTQLWHLTAKPNGYTLLNKSGGRAAEIWGGTASAGARIGQWVDDVANGLWKLVPTDDGYVKLQSTGNSNLYVTGASAGAPLTLQNAASDGSQEWKLVPLTPVAGDLTAGSRADNLAGDEPAAAGGTLALNAAASDPSGAPLHASTPGHAYLFDASGAATDLGQVSFGADQKGEVPLPASLAPATSYSVVVTFDNTGLMWDSFTTAKAAATVSAPAVTTNWGTAAKVLVTVTADAAPVTGQVTLTEGSTDRGTATLVHGQATFTLPIGLAGGEHILTATYSGSDQLASANASVHVTVRLPAVWSPTTTYQTGDKVTYDGNVYQAGWYSKGERPGNANGAWQQLAMTDDGTAIWTPSRVFLAGDTVIYQGKTFRADWYTRNEQPGSTTGPWEEIATAPDGTAIWTPSRVFNAGDRVVYNGQDFVARWYTRNQAPGSPNGPWSAVS